MEKRIMGILISLISLCLFLGIISHLTGLDAGEMIISGFGSMKRVLLGVKGQ